MLNSLTKGVREEQTILISKDSLFLKTNTQRKIDHILSYRYIADPFEVLSSFSAMPDEPQPICLMLFL